MKILLVLALLAVVAFVLVEHFTASEETFQAKPKRDPLAFLDEDILDVPCGCGP